MKKMEIKKKYRNGRQLRQKLYIGCLLVCACGLLGGVWARYIHESVTESSQIIADKFYFTTAFLGDTKMVTYDNLEQTNYTFDDKSTEGQWSLYGASAHNVTIQVQNYFDELRITEEPIKYEGSVTVQDADGKEIAKESGSSFPELKNGSDLFSNGTLAPNGSSKKAASEITLVIPSYTDWNYKDGTVVTAKIESTSPYRKTLTMKFVLYATDTTLKYEVVDSAGSPYAELILMTNVSGEVWPYLQWSEKLSIDNTNPLTYTYENGIFSQQGQMENRHMQLSQALETGRSESIYFFKSDTSENYSQPTTVVNPVNERYTIKLGIE